MNANEILFRCSSLGHLMTNPRSKSELISDTTKTHLIDVFISWKYKRREELKNKFLTKGNECEEDSITLLSRVTKTLYNKNSIRVSNDFITGEADLFTGESIYKSETITDTKTSWSMHTFMRSSFSELSKLYYWQDVGYMWLTGAKQASTAFCLVNGTPQAINDEKRRLAYQMGVIDTDSNNPEYKAKCRQIEINHIFDRELFEAQHGWFEFDIPKNEWTFDVPKNERVKIFTIERNEDEIEALKNRIIDCRQWITDNLLTNNN